MSLALINLFELCTHLEILSLAHLPLNQEGALGLLNERLRVVKLKNCIMGHNDYIQEISHGLMESKVREYSVQWAESIQVGAHNMELLRLDRDALTEMVGKNLTQFCLYVDAFSPE